MIEADPLVRKLKDDMSRDALTADEQDLDDEAKPYLEKAQAAQSVLGKDDQSMLKDLQAQIKR